LTRKAHIVLRISVNVFTQIYSLLFGGYKYKQGDKIEMDGLAVTKARMGEVRYR